jgi:hypothetical protein
LILKCVESCAISLVYFLHCFPILRKFLSFLWVHNVSFSLVQLLRPPKYTIDFYRLRFSLILRKFSKCFTAGLGYLPIISSIPTTPIVPIHFLYLSKFFKFYRRYAGCYDSSPYSHYPLVRNPTISQHLVKLFKSYNGSAGPHVFITPPYTPIHIVASCSYPTIPLPHCYTILIVHPPCGNSCLILSCSTMYI